jgi:hypothetical protein
MNDPRQQTPNNTPQEEPSLPEGEYPLYERIKPLPLALECSFRQNNDGMVIHARVVLYPESEGEAGLQTTFDPIFFPREIFKSDDQRDAYILAVRENLSSTLGSVISHAVLQEFLSAVHLAGHDVGLTDKSRKEVLSFILKSYTKADAQFLKNKLGMPGRGRRSAWNAQELIQAVEKMAAADWRRKKELPKLENLAWRLTKKYPEKPPLTVDSLHKLLSRAHRPYSEIKKDIQKPSQ